MGKEMQSKNVTFKVSARTARLIGRENVANAEAAVIELVKNGYDADAENVDIIFDKGDLFIIDSGVGMTTQVIEEKWMVIGTDNKRTNVRTLKGRIVSGEKGIGRFALDKLGGTVTVTSWTGQTKDDPIEWAAQWADFEQEDTTVDMVHATLVTTSVKHFLELYKRLTKRTTKHGTILHIRDVRDDWNEQHLQTLFESMRALVPPANDRDFSITLRSNKHPKEWGDVQPLIAENYDYRLEATYDAERQQIDYTIYRNEFDITLLEKKYAQVFDEKHMGEVPFDLATFHKGFYSGLIPLRKALRSDAINLDTLGTFSFDLVFSKITKPNDEDIARFPYKTVDYRERASWLKKFGGIRIFRDNFRVRPYGESGDDWLRLGERQAQSPGGAAQRLGGYRVRPNQVTGSIYISRLHNEALQDKSSREGIVENESFELLKNIIKNMLTILENDRNTILFSLSELDKRMSEKSRIESEGRAALAEIRQEEQQGDDKNHKQRSKGNDERAEKVFDYAEALESKVDDKDEEIRLLRSLASAGIITAAAAHELNGLKNHMSVRMRQFDRLLNEHLDRNDFDKVPISKNPFARIEQMAEADEKIVSWLDYALMPLRRDKRTRKNVNISSYLTGLSSIWTPLLQNRKINLEIRTEIADDTVVRLFPIDLDTVFNNLIINSMEAFVYHKRLQVRHIGIRVHESDGKVFIDYEDNAGGLDESFLSDPEQIYLPHTTTKVNALGEPIGTGMGMYLLKAILDDNGAVPQIDISESGVFRMNIELIASTS